MRALRVAVLAVVVVTSGCLGAVADDGTGSGPSTTAGTDGAPSPNGSPTAGTGDARATTSPGDAPTATATPGADCSSANSPALSPAEGADGSAGVAVEPVTLHPGENATVTVTARNVGELHVRRPGNGTVELDLDFDFDPSFDLVYPTPNPYWEWDPVEPEVTAAVPVRVPPDADPGTYCGPVVRAWNDTDHDHEGGATARFVVHVPNGTDDR